MTKTVLAGIFQRYDGTSATLEIVLMLLGAFIFGYLIRMFVSKWKSKAKEMEGELDLTNSRYSKLKSDYEHLQSEYDHQKTVFDKGRNELELLQMKTKNQGSNQDWKKEKDRLNNEITELKKRTANQLNEKEAMIADLRASINTNPPPVESNDAELESLKNELRKSNEKLERFKDYDAMKASHAQLKSELESLQLKSDQSYSLSAPGIDISDDAKDDLKKIEGIGPKIEQLLNAGGIRTFEALSNAKIESIQSILTEAGSRYKMHNPKTWPAQAKFAADGAWDELQKWQDELSGGVES